MKYYNCSGETQFKYICAPFENCQIEKIKLRLSIFIFYVIVKVLVDINSCFRFGGFMKKLSILLFASLFAHSFPIDASFPNIEVKEWQETKHYKEEFYKANTNYKIILYMNSSWSYTDYYTRLKKSNFPGISLVGYKKREKGTSDFYAVELNFNPPHTITKDELEKQLRKILFHDVSPFHFSYHVSLETGNDAYFKYQHLNW